MKRSGDYNRFEDNRGGRGRKRQRNDYDRREQPFQGPSSSPQSHNSSQSRPSHSPSTYRSFNEGRQQSQRYEDPVRVPGGSGRAESSSFISASFQPLHFQSLHQPSNYNGPEERGPSPSSPYGRFTSERRQQPFADLGGSVRAESSHTSALYQPPNFQRLHPSSNYTKGDALSSASEARSQDPSGHQQFQGLKTKFFFNNQSSGSSKNTVPEFRESISMKPQPDNLAGVPKYREFFAKYKDNPNSRECSMMSQQFLKLSLDDQFKEFLNAVCLTKEEWQRRQEFLEDLEAVLSTTFPHSKVYAFGSYVTGLGDWESDIDAFVDISGDNNSANTSREKGQARPDKLVLNDCLKVLRQARCRRSNYLFTTRKTVPIRHAKVPIIKFQHTLTSVHCDLSFKNLIAVKNSEMIKLYTKLHPVVRPLLIMLRYWGKVQKLTGSSFVKNYALILMALTFLGIKKIIPSVDVLRSIKKDNGRDAQEGSDLVEGWETYYCDDLDMIKANFQASIPPEEAEKDLIETTRILLVEFFDHIAAVDFTRQMICPYLFELLPKSIFAAGNEGHLPQSLFRYKCWSLQQTSDRDRLNNRSYLCIQDPFVLNFNVASGTSESTLLKFQTACSLTNEKLTATTVSPSILDTFMPLPVDLNCKFLSKRSKFKIAAELTAEITNHIKYKGDGSNQAHPPVAYDYKRMAKTMKAWEFCSIFEMDHCFKHLFVREMVDSQLFEKLSPKILSDALKVMWALFVEEFFREVWVTTFNFQIDPVHYNKYRNESSTSTTGGRSGRSSLEAFVEEQVKVKISSVDQNVNAVNLERQSFLKEKIEGVPSLVEKTTYQKWHCHSNTPVWMDRDTTFERVFISRSANSAIRSDPKVVAPRSIKEILIAKASTKEQRRIVNFDPLYLEQQITEAIIEAPPSKINVESLSTDLQFYFLFKLDCTYEGDVPTVSFVFSRIDETNYHAGVQTFFPLLNDLLPEYLMYRLKKWLGLD